MDAAADTGGEPGARRHFFVSYVESERSWAEWIAWQLEEDGCHVLVEAWDAIPGTNWVGQLQNGIENAEHTLVLLSPDYLSRVEQRAEWKSVFASDPDGVKRRLIPVRVVKCSLPGLFAPLIPVDLFDLEPDAARTRMLELVRDLREGRAKPLVEPPFPGLDVARPPFSGVEIPGRESTSSPWPRRITTLEPVKEHPGAITTVSLSFSADSRFLAAAGPFTGVAVWDLATHELANRVMTHQSVPERVEFSPTGPTLACAGARGVVTLWDAQAGTRHSTVTGPHPRRPKINDLAFGAGGDLLAVVGSAECALWGIADPARPHRLAELAPAWDSTMSSIAIHPTGHLIATANNGRVTLRTLDPQGRLTDGAACVAMAGRVRFSPNGGWLAAAGMLVEGLQLWPVDGDAVVAPPRQLDVQDDPYLDSATQISFSADGRWLVAASHSDVVIWEWVAGTPIARACLSFDTPVTAFALSPDSTMLATAADLGLIRLWDLT